MKLVYPTFVFFFFHSYHLFSQSFSVCFLTQLKKKKMWVEMSHYHHVAVEWRCSTQTEWDSDQHPIAECLCQSSKPQLIKTLFYLQVVPLVTNNSLVKSTEIWSGSANLVLKIHHAEGRCVGWRAQISQTGCKPWHKANNALFRVNVEEVTLLYIEHVSTI